MRPIGNAQPLCLPFRRLMLLLPFRARRSRSSHAPQVISLHLTHSCPLLRTQVLTNLFLPSRTPLHHSPLKNRHCASLPFPPPRLSHANNAQAFSLPLLMHSDFERSLVRSHARNPLPPRYPAITVYPTSLKSALTIAICQLPPPSLGPPHTWTESMKNASA